MIYEAGERVELIRITDPYTRLEPGTRGTVTGTDAAGTVHVHWDSGERLGVIFAEGDSIVPVAVEADAVER